MTIPDLIELIKKDPEEMVAVFKDVAEKGLKGSGIDSLAGVPHRFLLLDGHRFDVLIFDGHWCAFIDGEEVTTLLPQQPIC